ncbi:MAG TPA: c-type cytochrome [Gemmatimonadaceae bacterium]|nr:c-type cytochrome [Gemmatimonadaceae bacterium]
MTEPAVVESAGRARGIGVTVLATLVVALAAGSARAQAPHPGQPVYDKWCAGCHGVEGDGRGPAAGFMLPPPRDFTRASYQIRSTATGQLPTDADLRRVIDDGMPGTAMPGWRTILTARQRDDLVSYLKTFSRFFEDQPPEPLRFGGAPGGGDEAIAEGRRVYETLECWRCHGQEGRGDGASAPTLTDDWNAPIRAADLTENWHFNGGGSVEEIYARLRTGLDGTPMPTFTDAVEGGIITDEQLWRVAQYVRSLSPARAPAVREVVRAYRIDDGSLPSSPTDSAWAGIERFYIPLVGQIIVRPRWFAPSVDGVWVQAVHDDTTLALRLVWHDPSRSPDPSWDEWLERVRAVHTEVDGPPAATQGPDRFVVQFPSQLEGERPFFLGGSARRPAHGWRWSSAPDRAEEGALTGLGRFAPRQGAPDVRHQAVFENGAWHLLLSRTLVPTDTAAAPTLVVGRAIPIAFYAADGSSGEDEMRGAVSAWYAIYLDVPTPRGVYIAPLTTMLLTAGLGLVLVRQAQRRGRDPERPTSEES